MPRDTFHRFHFTFAEAQPKPDDMRAFLKSEDADVDRLIGEVVETLLPLLTDNPGIAGGYRLRTATEVHLHTGSQVRSYMKGADELALFACTAGPLFTELSSRYQQEGNYLEAFVTDALGSLTVERAMDLIQSQLAEAMAAEGLSISNRYSPGYCNWPVAGQQELFDELGEMPVAISLTESCLMLPIKSVSGIIGVGKRVRKRPYACQVCKNKSCTYRKIIQ